MNTISMEVQEHLPALSLKKFIITEKRPQTAMKPHFTTVKLRYWVTITKPIWEDKSFEAILQIAIFNVNGTARLIIADFPMWI